MDMKNLKTYRMFESVTELTKDQVRWLDECTKETWTLNPQTGLIDVEGDFRCHNQGLKDFKGVKFGVVTGDFRCHFNQLTSLVGAPQWVGVTFACSHNSLTSLEGAPQVVGEDFVCDNNQLTTLVGAPTSDIGYFNCEDNALTSLEGAPQRIKYGFYCSYNALTSLVGAPQRTKCGLSCENNPVSEKTLKAIFAKMKKGTSYLAAVESIWSEIPPDDRALLYADDFKWVTPEQSRGLVALKAYQGLRGML
jgi:hypothetical protein